MRQLFSPSQRSTEMSSNEKDVLARLFKTYIKKAMQKTTMVVIFPKLSNINETIGVRAWIVFPATTAENTIKYFLLGRKDHYLLGLPEDAVYWEEGDCHEPI